MQIFFTSFIGKRKEIRLPFQFQLRSKTMEDREIRRLEMLNRVHTIVTDNIDSLKDLNQAIKLFDIIGSAINELKAYSAMQTSSNRSSQKGTAIKSILRDELQEDLMAISRTARAIDEDIPTIENKFRIPRDPTDQTLLSTARAFAIDIVPFGSQFIEYGMPADFIQVLDKNIKLFEEAVVEQNLGFSNRVEATATIEKEIERGVKAVKRLDAIIRNRFADNSVKLAAWSSAKHIERAPRPAPAETTSEPEKAGN
jgi:hypothetical protein